MNCKTIGENLSAYLDKALPADEMQRIAMHLESCPECRQEYVGLQKTVSLLTSLEESIPPASFRRELRSKLEKSGGKKPFSFEAFLQRLPNLRRSALAPVAVAMILLIVAIPFIIDSPNMSLSKGKAPEAAQTAANEVRGTAPGGGVNFTAKSLSDTAITVQPTVGAADTSYGAKGVVTSKAEAVTDSSRSSMMATTLSEGAAATTKAAEPPQAAPMQIERKIIKNGDLFLQVDSYSQTVEKLKKQVVAVGGYIANESVTASNPKEMVRGSLQVRIPYQQFDPFLNGVESLGKVQNRNIYTQDVTEQFVDVESRLKAMRTKEERLVAILQKAGQLADVLAVENELANTRAELESLEGRLRFLSNQVDYSTINISIEQVVVPTQNISATGLQGVFLRAKEAFIKTINNILLDTGKLVVWIGSALPYLIILVALVYIFWRWIRRKVG